MNDTNVCLSPYKGVTESFGPLFEEAIARGPHYSFQSFSSGSCGNCSIITYKDTSLLIDLGIGAKSFAKTLKEHNIDTSRLKGILVTHDHGDHIRGVAPFAYRNGLPIFVSEGVAHRLLSSRYIREDISGHVRRIKPGQSFQIGEMSIEPFSVPHDATDNLGYSISSEAGVFTLITDIGHITSDIEDAISRSNFLVFESNYDEDMLLKGNYSPLLKQRIKSGYGHISNRTSADTIARMYHKGLKFLALCHLSGDNNIPELAMQTMNETLTQNGIDTSSQLKLTILGRQIVSPLFSLTIV